MAKRDATNTGTMPSFPSIKNYERRCVILRAEGKTYEAITNHINDEFALSYAVITVKEWFYAGGKLEQAYHEYLEADAALTLKEARQAIKRSTKSAVATVLVQMNSPDGRLALDAAKTILNKYIPDRQIMHEGGELDEDVPSELLEAADAIAKIKSEDEDGSHPVDDAPQGGTDSEEAGTGPL